MRTTYALPRPWAGAPLLVLVIAFVAFSLPPYLTLDPAQSRVPIAGTRAGYYPMLVGHVICGAIAILGSCFQVWPWFRARFPEVHRRIGLTYVFAGVLPAGGLGLILGAQSPFGPVISVSNVLLATVWVVVTVLGYRAGRDYRLTEHRRWMTRSVVLTLSIITNRVWVVVWVLALSPQLATTFGGSETLMIQTIAGLSGWLGWVLPLVAAELWLDLRTPRTTAAATTLVPS